MTVSVSEFVMSKSWRARDYGGFCTVHRSLTLCRTGIGFVTLIIVSISHSHRISIRRITSDHYQPYRSFILVYC
jgi:hypothetical protein